MFPFDLSMLNTIFYTYLYIRFNELLNIFWKGQLFKQTNKITGNKNIPEIRPQCVRQHFVASLHTGLYAISAHIIPAVLWATKMSHPASFAGWWDNSQTPSDPMRSTALRNVCLFYACMHHSPVRALCFMFHSMCATLMREVGAVLWRRRKGMLAAWRHRRRRV